MSEMSPKSRPRRLRVATGCRTCRKRHVKCDERRPTCANCSKKNRACHYDPPKRRQLSADAPPLSAVGGDANKTAGSPTTEIPGVVASYPLLGEDAQSLEAIFLDSTAVSCPPISTESPLSPVQATLESILLSGAERWADYQREDTSTLVASGVQGAQLDDLPPQSPVLRVDQRLVLTEAEMAIFRNYVENVSHWVDSFSHDKPFHRTVPVLALHCPPLLHACLAFSSKQMILVGIKDSLVVHEGTELRYYRLALNAISALLWHPQYAQSDEVLAACVILSTYEMLDVVGGSLGSHLKGVAALLQSRQINGDMSGIRGASYWTWYRHEIWAAFKTGRKMSLDENYWKPNDVASFEDLPVEDVANRVLFILGQCVTFFNHGGQGERHEQDVWAGSASIHAVALKKPLDEWKMKLPPSMTGFSVNSATPNGSPSTWFLSPQSAIAHQAYHACNLFLSINRPPSPVKARSFGVHSFLSLRRQISTSCEQIFLVANAGVPNAWSLVSAQCLYIAGMVMEGAHRRRRTIELIDECQRRTGRKTLLLAEELRTLWEYESDI